MIKLSNEEIIKKYDVLPDNVRQALLSDQTIDMLWKIGEAHHLGEERIRKIALVVGYTVLGLIHVEDLAKEISTEAGVDKRVAEEVAKEIRLKIINPIMAGGRTPAAAVTAQTPQPVTATPPAPSQEVLKPTFAPSVEVTPPPTTPEPVTPFILHEEKEIEPVARPSEDLVRPSFYEEPNLRQGFGGQGREAGIERPVSARLEIGGTPRKKEARIGRTGEPTVRVVHYAGPKTPVDPFAPQPPREEQEKDTEIPPENVVDLKDLPK